MPQTQRNPVPTQEISLKEALEKGPTLFYKHRGREEEGIKKREVDKEALKKALGKALQEGQKTKRGQLHEGETVYF